VKCAHCQKELDVPSMVLTLIAHAGTYTASVHYNCIGAIIGVGNARKLRTLAFDSGWVQTGLPLLRGQARD
jgi:hypothetical protein